jgi:hypothetical protein
MRVRISIVLAALLIPMLLPGAVGARSSQAAVKAADAALLAYWTPERIANAKTRDYVRNGAGKMVPFAKPGGGGGNVAGASWALGGAIQSRSGRILFSSGGSDWICSGSVVSDGLNNSRSVILTAGHCVFDGADGWSYNFLYMPNFDAEPNYDCATRNLGCWRATQLAANADFVPDGFGTDETVAVDYGFAEVGLRLNGNTELDVLYGGYTLKTASLPALNATQYAFGYPAEGRYKGKDLIYCKGPTINDPYGANTTGIGCNMNGGSSGGPRLADTTAPENGSGALASVNSYGYSGLTYMFGPKFNGETATVYGDLLDNGATGGVTVLCSIGTTEPSC